MARPPNPYTKLPGRALRKGFATVSTTRCRLWLGPDHLLAVESTIASEAYRRFFFRDIEAFVIRRTAGRMIWNWLYAILAVLMAGPLIFGWRESGDGGFVIGAIVCSAVWAVLILINSLRGATCETHVRTFVQLERLPSLGRMPVARRVLARVRPLIEAAQGGLTAEEVSEAPWITPDPAQARRQGGRDLPATLVDRGFFHLALAVVLVLDAIVGFLFFKSGNNEALAGVNLFLSFAGFLGCIVALIRQRDYIVAAGLRLFAKLSLGYYILGFITGIVFGVLFTIRHEGQTVLTGLEVIGEPGFAETLMVTSSLSALLACYGLVQWVLQSRPRGSSEEV